MEKKEHRLNELLLKLKLNPKEFAESIGLKRADRIYFVLNGRNDISTNLARMINDKYPSVNIDWLLTGEGEMLLNDATTKEVNVAESKYNGYTTYLLPMSAMGGSLVGFAEQGVVLQNCEAIVSPIENVDFAITVYGDSMAPEYPSGSRILIKKINPNLFIDWGKVYVLDTPNGVVVKEIHESDKEGYVSCYSINPDPKFRPFDVPANEIFGMYRVLMSLSAK